jgi:hypothetical protein
MVGPATVLLFRCHVLGGAGRLAFRGGRIGFLRMEHLCDAEVRDLHATGFVEEQVLRLDVAMHDAVFMDVLQGLADRRDDGEGLLRA